MEDEPPPLVPPPPAPALQREHPEPGPGPHPRAGAPSCGRAAVPAATGSPADHAPRHQRNKRRRKFPSQAVCERSRPGLGASMRGRGGSGAQGGDDREKSGPRRTPLELRGAPQRGSGPGHPEGKGFSRTQTLQQNAGAEPGPKPGRGASAPHPQATSTRLGHLGLPYSFY